MRRIAEEAGIDGLLGDIGEVKCWENNAVAGYDHSVPRLLGGLPMAASRRRRKSMANKGTPRMPEEYLQAVKRCTELALVQTGKLARCEHHPAVLLHTGDESNLHVATNLATIWIKNEAGVSFVMREDLNDAVRDTLARAAHDGCPVRHRRSKAAALLCIR